MRRDLSWRHFYHGCFARAMKVKHLLLDRRDELLEELR
jgi:hypothetical protein